MGWPGLAVDFSQRLSILSGIFPTIHLRTTWLDRFNKLFQKDKIGLTVQSLQRVQEDKAQREIDHGLFSGEGSAFLGNVL